GVDSSSDEPQATPASVRTAITKPSFFMEPSVADERAHSRTAPPSVEGHGRGHARCVTLRNPELPRLQGRLGAILHAELAEDARDMIFHRPLGDIESDGDLLVARALR